MMPVATSAAAPETSAMTSFTFTPSTDTQRINEILNGIYNAALYIPDHFAQNSVPHPPASRRTRARDLVSR
jgi:hypothetical protein